MYIKKETAQNLHAVKEENLEESDQFLTSDEKERKMASKMFNQTGGLPLQREKAVRVWKARGIVMPTN
jgi:hypothetical protein